MTNLQFEEYVKNIITTIIKKHPHSEPDLLYLRTIFIDQREHLKEETIKNRNKYLKLKQKVSQNQQNLNSQTNRVKSPSHFSRQADTLSPRHYQKSTKQHLDRYSPGLMEIILSEAKSIKTIFQSLIQTQNNSLSIPKFATLFNTYKIFYKSFKRQHKQYIQKFSYDQKQIHKNSTAMKHRLLEELTYQTQKRKQLEKQLEALQAAMEKSLLQKDKLINYLKSQIKQIQSKYHALKSHQINNNTNKQVNNGFKFNHDQNLLSESETQQSLHKQGPVIKYQVQMQKVSKNINSHQKQDQINLNFKKEKKNILNLQKSKSSQSQNSQNQGYQSFKEKPMLNENVGKFYAGIQAINLGKLKGQNEKSPIQISNSHNQNSNNIVYPLEKPNSDIRHVSGVFYQNNIGNFSKPKSNVPIQHRITFGSPGKSINLMTQTVLKPNSKQISSNEKSGMIEEKQKNLLKQINSLQQELKIQKMQKNELDKKIQQNTKDYKKLQDQVNQLFALIQGKNQIITKHQFNESKNLHNLVNQNDSKKQQKDKQSQQNKPIGASLQNNIYPTKKDQMNRQNNFLSNQMKYKDKKPISPINKIPPKDPSKKDNSLLKNQSQISKISYFDQSQKDQLKSQLDLSNIKLSRIADISIGRQNSHENGNNSNEKRVNFVTQNNKSHLNTSQLDKSHDKSGYSGRNTQQQLLRQLQDYYHEKYEQKQRQIEQLEKKCQIKNKKIQDSKHIKEDLTLMLLLQAMGVQDLLKKQASYKQRQQSNFPLHHYQARNLNQEYLLHY